MHSKGGASKAMQIVLNGNQFDTEARTVEELLSNLQIKPERVAVEINLNIIKKADFSTTAIKDGDVVEIINFVGGG